MLTKHQQFKKRTFDLVLGLQMLIVCFPVFFLVYIIGCLKFQNKPFFKTLRIGQFGKLFWLYKFRIHKGEEHFDNAKIKHLGTYARFLNKSKLNELPQLWQVVTGEMSLVGPRPDVSGYADRLEGKCRLLLQLKPGITGPATLKYKNEINILQTKKTPCQYNEEVIWPDKVKLNMHYLQNWSIQKDIFYLWKTIK